MLQLIERESGDLKPYIISLIDVFKGDHASFHFIFISYRISQPETKLEYSNGFLYDNYLFLRGF